MTAQLIDKIIYLLFMFLFIAIPALIISIPICAILDIKIKQGSKNKNYLGKGKIRNEKKKR